MTTMWTIGHSNHAIEKFMGLVQEHHISALADVRTQPYSRMSPQFNREGLKNLLLINRVHYVFLGKELGARPDDMSVYEHGRVSYKKLGASKLFLSGVERIVKGSGQYKLALLCAEKDPLQCHRSILIARHLISNGHTVNHILEDGSIETQAQAIARLKIEVGVSDKDFFSASADTEDAAYEAQEARIAFKLKDSSSASKTQDDCV